MYKTKGTIKRIGEIQTFGEFQKRELVLTTKDGKFEQTIQFTLTKDRIELANGVKEGQEVEVSWFLNGREWTGDKGVKVFNSLDAWKIEPVGVEEPTAVQMGDDSEDDLPF